MGGVSVGAEYPAPGWGSVGWWSGGLRDSAGEISRVRRFRSCCGGWGHVSASDGAGRGKGVAEWADGDVWHVPACQQGIN